MLEIKYLKNLLLCFFPGAGVHPEQSIERTKTHKACEYKYTGQYQKHNSDGSGDDSREIEYCNSCNNNQPDNFVCVTHVFFHDLNFNWLYIE